MIPRLAPLLVLAVAAGPLAAQQPPPQPPGRTPFDPYRSAVTTALRMHTDPAVQAELKLTDDQKAKLAKMPDDLLAKHKEAIDKEKNAAKEASEKAAAEQAERVKKFDALQEKNLTADQRKRLNQLAVRSMGISAFTNAEVSKALGLTTESTTKLRELQQAGRDKLDKEFPNFTPFNADSGMQAKYIEAQAKMTRDTFDQFVATLTDEQKKAWRELTGEPSEAVTPSGAVVRFGAAFDFNSMNTYKNYLLANEKVLTELKVEKAARDALTEGLKALTPDPRGRRDVPVAGPDGFASSVRTTLSREALAAADELLTASQAKRLEQVNFQIRGVGVFSSSPVFGGPGGRGQFASPEPTPNPLTRLTLTPAQVVKIDDIVNDSLRKQQEVQLPRNGFFGTTNPPDKQTDEEKARLEESRKALEEYRRKLNEIDQKAMADITDTFDAGQKRVWKEMTGEPFDTTKMTSLGRGIGGGGGPGGPRGATRISIVSLWTREASRLNSAGEYAAALATYDEAIRLAPTNTPARLSKARMLASCPSEWVRDGKQAVELMTKVMAETKEPSYSEYDVLAMAYAEAGQFDEAVKAQQKAIEMMPKPAENAPSPSFVSQRKQEFEERLKLYQEKKPFRITPPPTTAPGGGR